MAQLLNKEGLQHYANKMCNANNRKVGDKSLPTALNDIDLKLDQMKTLFDQEYGTPLEMKINNNENIFSVGQGIDIDKRSDVENGFTDVEISGNSMVNHFTTVYDFVSQGDGISRNNFTITLSNKYNWSKIGNRMKLKPNTLYCAIITCQNNSAISCVAYIRFSNDINGATATSFPIFSPNSTTTNYKTFTTDSTGLVLLTVERNIDQNAGSSTFYNIMVLEGDYTNKPMPQYFEGLKSVGEKEVGDHKIEISSLKGNPNLLKIDENLGLADEIKCEIVEDQGMKNVLKFSGNFAGNYCSTGFANSQGLSDGDWVTISVLARVENIENKNLTFYLGDNQPDSYTDLQPCLTNEYQWVTQTRLYKSNGNLRTHLGLANLNGGIVYISKIKVEKGNIVTPWVPVETDIDFNKYRDKKEISLSEPLRGLPNGVKDSIELINGEWKIVRRCGQYVLNETTKWVSGADHRINGYWIRVVDYDIPNFKNRGYMLSDNLIFDDSAWSDESLNKFGIWDWTGFNFYVFVPNSLSGWNNETVLDSTIISNFMGVNPVIMVYQLETPIIEDIDPVTLQCWKNGAISINEVLPVETNHTVALNKPAQIKKNIEELTILKNKVKNLEEQYDTIALNQAYELKLLKQDIELDYNTNL